MTPTAWFHVVSVLAAGIGIGIGVLMPARAQMNASAAAQRAMARQPDEAGTISRNLFIGLAMIESLALYVLITVLIVLFANPLENRLADAEAIGPGAVWFLTGSSAAAIIAIAIAAMLAAIGQGRVTASALESISEQPEMRGRISTTLFISLAFLESLALYALIVGLILVFANPLLSNVIP